MKIEVTEQDIHQGVRQCCLECPIALAISRACNTDAVKVGFGTIIIGTNVYKIPRLAQDFIERYDDSMDVAPFTFELDL